jgi:hypothetical protein
MEHIMAEANKTKLKEIKKKKHTKKYVRSKFVFLSFIYKCNSKEK